MRFTVREAPCWIDVVVSPEQIKTSLLLHHHQHHRCPFCWPQNPGLISTLLLPPFYWDPEEQVACYVRSKQQEENRISVEGGGRDREAWSSNSTIFKAVGNARFEGGGNLFFKAVGFLSGVWSPTFVFDGYRTALLNSLFWTWPRLPSPWVTRKFSLLLRIRPFDEFGKQFYWNRAWIFKVWNRGI